MKIVAPEGLCRMETHDHHQQRGKVLRPTQRSGRNIQKGQLFEGTHRLLYSINIVQSKNSCKATPK